MDTGETRVLIAEDDYLVGEMIKGVAESIGYTIVGEASNGIEAVEQTKLLRPDVVLMDIRMPEMDGVTATRHIYQQCPTPVIILTAYETPDLLEQASAAGVAAYLVKPPQAREMERAVTIARARFADLLEVRRLKTEAEQAVQLRDELFALISHDLMTPLTAIKGYMELVQMRVQAANAQQLTEQLQPDIVKIDAAVRRMTGQITEFLDISRLRAGQRFDLHRVSTDLISLVCQIVTDAQQVTKTHQVYVETSIPHLYANVDAIRLERVIGNLLSNAIKYSPHGGNIIVTIDEEHSHEPSWANIAISDQGVGIPLNDLQHIFDPFHRAPNVIGQSDGIGLGLASVRQIIEWHGGTIDVKSQINAGSTFTVRIPCVHINTDNAPTTIGT
ncbi:MAG: hybrid sensor histidine kinase/response regulator [Chloroflexota bacterium]